MLLQELVAFAPYGHQEYRVFGIRLDLSPQFGNVNIHRPGFDVCRFFVAPYFGEEFIP